MLLSKGCAWTSSFDLLENNPWLRCTETKRKDSNNELIKVLKGDHDSSFEKAAIQLYKLSTNDLRKPGEEEEDPWLIVRGLMVMANDMKTLDINGNPIMPIV